MPYKGKTDSDTEQSTVTTTTTNGTVAASTNEDKIIYTVIYKDYDIYNKCVKITSNNKPLILTVGNKLELNAYVNNKIGTVNIKDSCVVWSSNMKSVATATNTLLTVKKSDSVPNVCTVTGVNTGNVTIMAIHKEVDIVYTARIGTIRYATKTISTWYATKFIRVLPFVASINMTGDNTTSIGKTTVITAIIKNNIPSNLTNKMNNNIASKIITWSNSNPSVASILYYDNSPMCYTQPFVVVKGLKVGTTVITAKSTDGSNISKSITITVSA